MPSTAPATPPGPPVVMNAKERLKRIIDELGADIVFDLLVATTNERIAA
jgi:hypothetical protein